MIQIRHANERGYADHGWLKARHSFSFASYYDPEHMGFRQLRVINDDRIAKGGGFPTHPHRDMEIVTYVIEGELSHKDSMGNGSIIRPGEVQRMSAGTGVRHSEFNTGDGELRLMQIWMVPRANDLRPGYEQKDFGKLRGNKMKLVVSPDGADGSVSIQQDTRLWASVLDKDKALEHKLGSHKYGWLQVAKGAIEVNGTPLTEGDGAAMVDESVLKIVGKSDKPADFLLFGLN